MPKIDKSDVMLRTRKLLMMIHVGETTVWDAAIRLSMLLTELHDAVIEDDSKPLDMEHGDCPSKQDIRAPRFVRNDRQSFTVAGGRVLAYECEACRTVVRVSNQQVELQPADPGKE
jgi:hypothetical protein